MKKKMRRMYVLAIFAVAAFFLVSGLATGLQKALAADKWPDKPIQLVVPWKPGGGTDRGARMFAPYLAKVLGVPVNIVNVAGGGGWVAWAQMAAWKYPRDQYMIGIVNIPHVMAYQDPRLKRKETWKSFGWLALHSFDPCTWLVRNNDERFPDLKAFIAYGKKTPIKINVAGFGGDDHQALVAVQKKIPDLKTINIYSNSDAEKIATTLGGETDAIGGNVAYFIPYVLEAKIRFLCVFNDERVRQIPNVPTFKEVTGIDLNAFVARAFAAPPNLPEEKRQILLKALKQAYQIPEYQMKALNAGDVVIYKDGADLEKMLADNAKMVAEVKYWEMKK
jgi:tripartite-type tricarboxylate transporter receptor subunit TctC